MSLNNTEEHTVDKVGIKTYTQEVLYNLQGL
jgi:hypothetical protein